MASPLALCAFTGEFKPLSGGVCTACGREVADPVEGDESHRTTFREEERMEEFLRALGYVKVDPGEPLPPLPKTRRTLGRRTHLRLVKDTGEGD